MSNDRKQDIVDAAIELFAMKGFRGTTTRDLAARAGVNEAIIFRHFATKEALYAAILERKACEKDIGNFEQIQRLSSSSDPVDFFECLGRMFLEHHESDPTFMRLLLFSALEGHALADMFIDTMADRVRDPVAQFIRRRIEEGTFRDADPVLAARALFGMFVSYFQWQEIFNQKKKKSYDRDEVVRTFVSIFLFGLKKEKQ